MADSTIDRKPAIRFIVALGLISLFADVTYEGARSILGPFLGTLGAGALVVGLVSGFGELAGYTLRLFSGYAADRTRSYWALTISGYVTNMVAVPLLALAKVWPVAAALVVLERAGKAIRTPARDVMLSQASKAVGRGWGFGLHEAMDQTGAFIGPLLVAAVLAETNAYGRAFTVLAIPAGLAIVTVLAAHRFYPHPSKFEQPSGQRISTKGLPRQFWMYVLAGALLAAGFVDFPLMAFHFQKQKLASQAAIPVIYAFAMGAEALTALIFGRLFDKIGVAALIAGVVLSAASSPLVFLGGLPMAIGGILLWGAGTGGQQSLLRAAIGDLVPVERRGAAYGIFNTAYGIAWFAGSAALGALYNVSFVALAAFAVISQTVAIPLLLMSRRHS
ncbi:MAG TPA: MFS transporter [Bryobacteraceae bacterium]|nr:MFS transporter [Bryobacteraceae bacterium]